MRTLLEFLALMLLGALLVVLGVILGDYASWYFAWIVGTAMIVLVSAAGLAWLDAQEAARAAAGPHPPSPRTASLPPDKS
ncbi:MAG: hypothetical protein KGJ03_05070 [Betaproteobacteria bacterium]|uniref:hypothetical protein n=1 Tax=Thiomonas sp. FB-6 TaxID=1158291 RepID=UPI0003633274|nr:hypothetical protein [Thiomonas sp. FB-6]MBU6439913.1 hypothetical protein [Betaproteobacteria bacterium]MBU6511784.1 hypothetical protein [Betaproteobacteria bacterium]MDE1955070.1 hypothetical protein [Betaproteobacteria bacterium]MDE2152092.1 hypothetical protein [Betaproteobacteria bacterium]MDE2479702.1 hypothetical protein [Betaproteobacteria bacterium]